MDLNHNSIHDVIHPTAAFAQWRTDVVPHDHSATGEPAWSDSQLNPKNRIDSLDPPLNPSWRIDGGTGLGSQYYAIPHFLGDVPPMRFDVYIPEPASADPHLRQLLGLSAAFHTKDPTRVNRLGISRHILRRLQLWASGQGREDEAPVADIYRKNPFGSWISFESCSLNIHNIKISISPSTDLEMTLLKLSGLASTLGLPEELIPEAVDISKLSIVQQLHDSVCIVTMKHNDEDGKKGQQEQKRWILKALTSETKYMYCELRNLLLMEPHPNVMSKPRYLVTKKCGFGNKIGVVGFILDFHSNGSVRDRIPLMRTHGLLTLDLKLKWAIQLASAVLHVRERGKMYYPDLRLDNVVVSAAGELVMVDFEQRGVWCEFASPEVNSISYMRIIAKDGLVDDGVDGDGSDDDEPQEKKEKKVIVPGEIRSHYHGIMNKLLPGWATLELNDKYDLHRNPHGYRSYNIDWLALDEIEQEASEVYMLGRVLWCIFEGQCAPQPAAAWQSYRREPDIEFPAYRETPEEMRAIIDACTKGRRKTLSGLVVRAGSKLLLRNEDGTVKKDCTPEEVLDAARDWWREEVSEAERFLEDRIKKKETGEWNSNPYGRPKMREVVQALKRFEVVHGRGGASEAEVLDALRKCDI
ncbi:ribosomal protein S6 kinase alpha-5 [Podospora fimiseda]|uniref:Ribosomal protein S6 kinase alpha-5 n=1 Tax=Podospora fimiseda TaxID=252190 RepID=A0AAN7BYM0_9PEZI|nr:ribosomal protein S6 kinase alpha-5 [Podospora fimiseda]